MAVQLIHNHLGHAHAGLRRLLRFRVDPLRQLPGDEDIAGRPGDDDQRELPRQIEADEKTEEKPGHKSGELLHEALDEGAERVDRIAEHPFVQETGREFAVKRQTELLQMVERLRAEVKHHRLLDQIDIAHGLIPEEGAPALDHEKDRRRRQRIVDAVPPAVSFDCGIDDVFRKERHGRERRADQHQQHRRAEHPESVRREQRGKPPENFTPMIVFDPELRFRRLFRRLVLRCFRHLLPTAPQMLNFGLPVK